MDRNNSTYKQLIFEHGSISHAARRLNITRKVIYDFIESGLISTRAKNKIEKAGYCPETFKPIIHVKEKET